MALLMTETSLFHTYTTAGTSNAFQWAGQPAQVAPSHEGPQPPSNA